MKCPCRGCEERYEACHDRCEKYKEWKVEHEAARKWLHDMELNPSCKAAELAFREKLRSRRR